MGMHADGEVFYGHDLGDLCDRETYEYVGPAWLRDEEHEDHGEWPDRLAALRGVVAVPFPEHAWDDARNRLDEAHPDVAAYRAYRDRVMEIERESSIELATYGHSEGETTWCVRVKASVVRATYDCVPLDFSETTGPNSQWDLDVAAFVRELELPVDGAPRWYVTSSYG